MHRVLIKYNPIKRICQVFILCFIIFSNAVPHSSIASEKSATNNYWILFSDKHSQSPEVMSQRAYERRQKRGSLDDYSWYDLAVDQSYLQIIQSHGAAIRTVSRWLNAASVSADDSILPAIYILPFVLKIVPVQSYTMPTPSMFEKKINLFGKPAVFDYGPSYLQISQINVDSLHNIGLSGRGVTIGMMDTGFDTNHPAFARMDSAHQIIITHDFINGDSNVVDGFDVQRGHGTSTLSVIGGFSPGNLIGPAYGADFILAKTEIINIRDTTIEEDYWVAASEWMESLGVDIISSSLGYLDWYDTLELDGKTALITKAANVADSLGIIVVNSAGNEGTNPFWRKIVPPSDGFSVIAVGAVDGDGNIVDFSSRGPTADGRIKPDVCALGLNDYVADYATRGYAFE